MTAAKTLRLILGDQLNSGHSWFSHRHDDVVYVLLEMRQETDYVLHHAQKIIAIFASMRDLARQLTHDGHRVHYLAIDDPANRQSLPANLDFLLAQYQANEFEYQAPDEWRLDQQMAIYCRSLRAPATARTITARMVDSDDNQIPERPWTNQSISYAMKDVQRQVQRNTKVFTQSFEGRPGSNNQVVDHFAAGDARQNSARQVVTATGDGATAAVAAERYISDRFPVE